jgi:hypothetical protein
MAGKNSKGQASQDQGCSPSGSLRVSPVKSGEREVPRKAAPIGEFLRVTVRSRKKAVP